MPHETKPKPILAGRAPDAVDAASRAAYETGLRDRAQIMDLEVDPTRAAATGPSEGNGGGGNVAELPVETPRAGTDKPRRQPD